MRTEHFGWLPCVMAALLLGLATAAPSGTSEGSATAAGAELAGIWAGRRSFGPEVRGPLTLERQGSRWRAEIAGFRAEVDAEGDVLAFALPGRLGAFRGRLEAATGTIYGQWIQPGVASMFGQRFSTPVRLDPVGATLWRGSVDPLPDAMHMYFVIEPGEAGAVRVFLRNPEVNLGRFFVFEEVRRQEESVELRGTLAWEKGSDAHPLMRGIYRRELDLLSVFVEDPAATYDLQRLDGDSVSGFHPRPHTELPYRYRIPTRQDDGWEIASLDAVGMAVEPIEALVSKIATTPMDALDAPYIDALLVARHGKLVVEEYFHGHSRDRTHDTRSASKSLTATLVGAAIRAGEITLETPVYRAMGDGVLPADLDPRASRMTVEHLITMTSGLACDDWDPESPGGEDRLQTQTEQSDWHRYLLDLPMAHEPGTHPAYCSGGMSLAGAVVARALGMPLTEAFDRLLARPLQLGTYHTNLMPNGEAYAGGGLRIRGRDFLKFGQLLLDDGEWNARRILDPGWAEASIERRHDLGGERFGSYGCGWWLLEYEVEGQTFAAFYAGGNGGNYIIGIPALDLAIVFLASNYNQAIQHETKLDDVPRYILRSALHWRAGSDASAASPRSRRETGHQGRAR